MNGRLVSRRDISLGHEKAMLELMQEHFDGVTAAMFRCDLAEKNWVIWLEDDLGRLRGFSTLLVYDSSVVPARIVYSGDTIVDRDAWGSPSLAKTWIRSVRELGADYWLLITSGSMSEDDIVFSQQDAIGICAREFIVAFNDLGKY